MTSIAYVANTNSLILRGLKSAVTGEYINDATVSVTVIANATGHEVEGEVWPHTMDYMLGSNGDYIVYLTHDLSLLKGKKYTARIDADGSNSDTELWGHWEFPFQAQIRTGVTV